MRLFKCQACEQLLYFENTRCERSGHRLGYLPEINQLSALEPQEDAWSALAQGGQSYRFCANAAHQACNWLIPSGSAGPYCTACRHNGTVPDLSNPENLRLWQVIEQAKHRLFYTLLKLELPIETRAENPEGLQFDFLGERGFL